MRCNSCLEYVPVNDKLECSGCFGCYHYVCAGFEKPAFRRLTDSIKLKWRCNTCRLDVDQDRLDLSVKYDRSDKSERTFNIPYLWISPCAAPNRCKSLQNPRIYGQTSPPSPISPPSLSSCPTSGGRCPGQPPMPAGGGRYPGPYLVPPPNRYAIPASMAPVIRCTPSNSRIAIRCPPLSPSRVRYPVQSPSVSPNGGGVLCPGPSCPSAPCDSGPGRNLKSPSASDHSFKLKILLRDIERTRDETENTMTRMQGLHGMKESIEAVKTRIDEFDVKFNTFCESLQEKKGEEKNDDKAEEDKDENKDENKDSNKDDNRDENKDEKKEEDDASEK